MTLSLVLSSPMSSFAHIIQSNIQLCVSVIHVVDHPVDFERCVSIDTDDLPFGMGHSIGSQHAALFLPTESPRSDKLFRQYSQGTCTCLLL